MERAPRGHVHTRRHVAAYDRAMPITHVIINTHTQSETGLPKDRFENVWHFLDVDGASAASVAQAGMQKIYDFFHTPPIGGGVAQVERWLAPSMDDLIHLTAYNYADAKPRPEIMTGNFTYVPLSGNRVPEEIALCLSYYTDRNLPSKRGRLYIGPFNQTALGAGGAESRPSDGLIQAMAVGGARLIVAGAPTIDYSGLTISTAPGGSAACAWALFSQKLATFSAIRAGWVDDEWDGQSRRRVEASTRSTFPSVIP